MAQLRDPNAKRDFMLNTPIPRLVPKMALPSIAGMLVTSAYNLADTLFVDDNLARSRRHNPANALHQHCFPRAVSPD